MKILLLCNLLLISLFTISTNANVNTVYSHANVNMCPKDVFCARSFQQCGISPIYLNVCPCSYWNEQCVNCLQSFMMITSESYNCCVMVNSTISVNNSVPINLCQPCNIAFYDCLLNTTSEINVGGVCQLNKHNVTVYTLICVFEGCAFIVVCLACCFCFKKQDREYMERMELLSQKYKNQNENV